LLTFDAHQVASQGFPALVQALGEAFARGLDAPERWSVPYAGRDGAPRTLMLMPAYDGEAVGVKLLTLTPGNPERGQPFIKGRYLLFDASDGEPRALIDAASLTNWRTAATSALASTYLSRPNSRTLLVLGTGALAPHLARAHASVRPIDRVFVWGRRPDRAGQTAEALADLGAEAAFDLSRAAAEADIISCATASERPLLAASDLHPGQHLDLVGGFRPNMQELSEEAVARATIFVDTRAGALSEAGDLRVPLDLGLIEEGDIRGELGQLASGSVPGRGGDDEITLFKSVGHAIEDLVAARLLVAGSAGVGG